MVNRFPDVFFIILTSIAGGLSQFMLMKEYTIRQFILLLVISSFAGYVTLQICIEFELSSNLTGAICGMAGFSSKNILSFYEKVLFSFMKNQRRKMQ